MKNIKTIVMTGLLLSATTVAFGQTNYSTAGWPPANILRQFGIEGMPQPTGAREAYWRGDWAEVQETVRSFTRGNPALLIGFSGTNATGTAIKNWFERNGWSQTDTRRNGAYYRKGNSVAFYDYASDNTGQIVAGVIQETGRNSALYGEWRNPSNGRTLIFSDEGWEWVDYSAGEYNYDGTTLTLTTWDDMQGTARVTISGNTITIGSFSGALSVKWFNDYVPGTYRKQ